MHRIIVTGGAGFIGSALIRELISNHDANVLNIDSLTYAGNLDSLNGANSSDNYSFCRLDINDKTEIRKIFKDFKPHFIMHLAAESHVDRSIDSPAEFINTNILGTFSLLEESRIYFENLNSNKKKDFRFHHISTDEVYGDLRKDDPPFNENNNYQPSSPYSASKASSDHLVRAWNRTFNLPILISNCSNNYGPFHFPEKFIPHIILSALHGKNIPIYGDGSQIRDWLYVEDHVSALLKIIFEGTIGETYNIGGDSEVTNLELVHHVCTLLNEHVEKKPKGISNFSELISFVEDRPGHDTRYAIDASKIKRELNWAPKEDLESGLRKTVKWYLENESWWKRVLSGDYKLERI